MVDTNKKIQLLVEKFLNEKPKINNGLLFTEEKDFKPCQIITEDIVGVGKKLYIQGIFSEFNNKNQNGRIYPEHIMKPEVLRYYEKYVKTGRALGEIGHPDSTTINLENVSHRIVELWIEGNYVYGKALIGGPKGDSIKKIIEMGGQLGISSRALGNMNHKNEVTELQIMTWDIVHEPSVASALMSPIVESKQIKESFDWFNDDSGFITESLKREFKIINNNMLLNEEEKIEYAKLYITDFFNSLH